MKRALFLFLLVAASIPSAAQFPAVPDSVYAFIKRNNIFRNSINWQQTDADFHACIRSSKTLNDTMNCFVNVLKQLNDVHSSFMINGRYYGHYNPLEDSVYKRIKPTRERAEAVTGMFYSTVLEKKYGYLVVPAISAWGNEEINRYAQALHDTVCRLSSHTLGGFIIDLRLNSGGNMYPMLAGLSSFLGNTAIGYETDIDNNVVRKWQIRNNDFFSNDYQATSIKAACHTDNSQLPVVILTGPVTGSSGSMTAIAFKQRPRTYFIGEPTADGYTTSNGFFQYPPNLSINLASYFVADRKMNVYRRTVDPDLLMYTTDNFGQLMSDEKIKAAIAWLSK
ncbi:MAG TPA: S41 family peptidase [Ferruginibacter sp.]|nr:hypothetical protein [Chitinophagaceae bacterium]HRI23852.1 S41 family peptidase [Ferruginibacter sp.]